MSSWTYVNGTITVSPMGRTQAEKTYILQTVLDHLPRVTGSERDMDIYVIQKNGYNSSSSCDEFGCCTNNLVDSYGDKSRNGWLRTQDNYIIVINGSLRDRVFEETLKEFNKWLCRLSKRLMVDSILVKINEYDKEIIINNDNPYYNMFEDVSWATNGKSENWCEYLMWDYPRDDEVNKDVRN